MRSWEADAEGRENPVPARSPSARANEASTNGSDTRFSAGGFMRGLLSVLAGNTRCWGAGILTPLSLVVKGIGARWGQMDQRDDRGATTRDTLRASGPRIPTIDRVPTAERIGTRSTGQACRLDHEQPGHQRSPRRGGRQATLPPRPTSHPCPQPNTPPSSQRRAPPRSHLDCRDALILILSHSPTPTPAPPPTPSPGP